MKKIAVITALLFLGLIPVARGDMVLFNGESGQRVYQNWWGGSAFVVTNLASHNGAHSGRWIETNGDGGGVLVLDPSWGTRDLSYMTNFEFWARTPAGTGSLVFALLDIVGNASKSYTVTPSSTWTKYTYSRRQITNAGFDLKKVQRLRMQTWTGGPRTTVYIDDIVVKTLGSPEIGILDGDMFPSTNHPTQQWDGTPTIQRVSTSPANGSYCEELTGSAQGDQLGVFNPGWDNIAFGEKSHLELQVRGAAGGEDIRLTIDGCNPVYLTNLSTSWQKVMIPLYDLTNGKGVSVFQNVSFYWMNGAGTFYIDDMKFPLSGVMGHVNPQITPAVILNDRTNSIQVQIGLTSIGTNGSASSIRGAVLDATPAGGGYIGLTNISGTAWRATVSMAPGLQAGSYMLRIQATNSEGNLYAMPVFDLTIYAPVGQPVIRSAVASATNLIGLSWADLPNETSYTLFRNTTESTSGLTLVAGTPANTTNLTVTGLQRDTLYHFYLKAYNQAGASGYSLVMTNRTFDIPPAAPSDLTALAVSDDSNSMVIFWDDVDNVTSYTLFRSTMPSTASAVAVAGFGEDVTNHTDTGLTGGTLYYYWIRAYSAYGASAWSLTATNRTSSVPAVPVFQSVLPVSGTTNRIRVTWQDLPNETSYTLFKNASNDFASATAVALSANMVCYTDSGLASDTIRFYWLRAANELGTSVSSTVRSNRTNPGDLTPPVSHISHAGGIYGGGVDLVVTAVDTNSGVRMVYYTTDNTDPLVSVTVQSGVSPLSVTVGESMTVRYYAEDNAGNKETPQSQVFEIMSLPEKDVAVYPNLLDLSSGEPARIVFKKTVRAAVRIYNIRGVMIHSIPEQAYPAGGFAEWDGSVGDSGKAGSGIYLISVTGDVKAVLKIIVKK